MKNLCIAFIGIIILSFNPVVEAQSNPSEYRLANKYILEGDGGWDYLSVDESAARIFISHSSIVQVLDLKSGKIFGTIPDTKGVHGIAIASDLNKAFISNGRDTSVTVIDLKTLAFITKIKVTGLNPDAILYDAFSKKIFVYNGRSANATVIDAVKNSVVATIPLSGKPEFSVTNGKGSVYVNIEDKSEICMINTTSLKVEKSWSIAPGEEPTGLALDNETNRLFAVCGNKLMIVVDANSGKIITTIPIGEGCDGVAFDTSLKRIYSSNGEGNMTVIQEISADKYLVLETVKTQAGARTISLDKTTHHIYLPTAEFDALDPSANDSNRRPVAKPGTFTVLDFELVK